MYPKQQQQQQNRKRNEKKGYVLRDIKSNFELFFEFLFCFSCTNSINGVNDRVS